MEIRIGMVNTARELVLQTTKTAPEVEKAIAEALANEGGTLRLDDEKGHIFVVASKNLAFVEIGEEKARKIGFAP